METSDCVLPVVVGEPFRFVVPEGRNEDRADRVRRLGRQVGGGEPAKADRGGV